MVRDLQKAIFENPKTLSELAKEFRCSKNQIKKQLTRLRKLGVPVERIKDEAGVTHYVIPSKLRSEVRIVDTEYFGLMGDTHLGSKYAEEEALQMYYDEIAERGIKEVFHAGDFLEGMNVYPGQVNDLKVIGLSNQIDYAIKNYPRRKGVKTRAISGNHDLKEFKKSGIDPVKQIADKRRDIDYLGQYYGRVRLKDDVLLELSHVSGSAPYSLSYRMQTYLRNRPPSKYPDILALGHLHTSFFADYQDVLTYNVGSFMGDTDYLRRKGIIATIGGWIVELEIEDGNIKKAKNEWVKF